MFNLKFLLGIAIIIFPVCGWAEDKESVLPIDLTHHWAGYFSLLVMVIAYIAAMFEDVTELRKSKPVLLVSALIWLAIVFVYRQHGDVAPAVLAFKANLLT